MLHEHSAGHQGVMDELYSSFLPVRDHNQCMSISPKLGCEPGTDDFDSNALHTIGNQAP